MTQTLKYKGYSGSVDFSLEDECLHGKIQFIEDIIAYEGQTVFELKQAFNDAVDRYLAYCEKTGRAAEKPFSGTFNIRTSPETHRRAAQVALDTNMTLNEWVSTAIQRAVNGSTTKIEHHHTHDVVVRVDETSGKLFQASSGSQLTETAYAH